MVERLEFVQATMYIQEKKTTVSGSMAREVEEKIGSSTDRVQHFHKQFHHEVESARQHTKSILGSHICMIFSWYKTERSKLQENPLPESIPLAAPPVRIVAPPISIADHERLGVGVAAARKIRSRELLEVTPNGEDVCDISEDDMPLSALKKGAGMLKLFSSRKKRRIIRSTGSSESEMEEDAPSSPQQNGTPSIEEANQEQEKREERPSNVPIGPIAPRYLCQPPRLGP
ncbi:unnamed protein product [Calypogeia fissa]